MAASYYTGFPVYEERDRIGGTAYSYSREGFVFDVGIHVLQSNKKYFHDLMENLGVEFVQHKRNAWIYSHGSYAAYPFQVNTSHLPVAIRMKCVLGYLFRSGNDEPGNYEEWLVANFGKGFALNFLIPYAEKFWRVSPKNMTFEWTDARIPRPRTVDVLKGAFRDQDTGLGTNPIFQYPSKKGAGFSAIAASFGSKVTDIRLGMKASKIDPVDRIIHFNGGGTKTRYDYVISTLPLPVILNLFDDLPPDISRAAKKLAFNSIAVINVAVGRNRLSDKHWIHYPGNDVSFFRINFPENFCEGLTPDNAASVQAEISYDMDTPPESEELKEKVLLDLVKVGVLRPDEKIIFTDVVYQDYGYVIYDKHRKDAVGTIHGYLNVLGIYPCGRYGAWEYLWSDDAIISGKKAADKVARLKAAG